MDGACCALSSHPEAGWSLPPLPLSFYFLVTFYAEAGSSLWRWDIIIIIIASRSKAQSGTQSSPRCGARTQVQAGSRSSPEGPASSCPAGAQQEDPPAGSASLRDCAPVVHFSQGLVPLLVQRFNCAQILEINLAV